MRAAIEHRAGAIVRRIGMRSVASRGFLLWTSVFLFCFSSFSVAQAKTGNSIRILSWNVRNYNLTDRYAHGHYRREYPKPEEEKAALRKVISEHQPDLMLLQEVGGNAYLQELSEDLKSEYSLEYPYFTTVVVEDEVRKLGVVSRQPFEENVNPVTEVEYFSYFDDEVQVKRGLLEVDVTFGNGKKLTCMTYHLKSRFTSDKRDPGSAIRREKEARTIRNYLRESMASEPEKRILMVGDLNDSYHSQAYDRLTKVSGEKVMIEVPVVDQNGESWTYFYAKERRYEQIDFLFVSPRLKDDDTLQITAQILGNRSVAAASDHRPIMVKITEIP